MPVPNEDEVTYLDQSELDKGDIDNAEHIAEGYWVYTGGGAVTAQGTPDGTVAVSAGTARVQGSDKTITAGNVSVISGAANPDGSTALAADATNLARFSLIVINSSSQLGVLHGTAAGLSPNNDGSYLAKFPSFAGKTLLAAVFVPPTFTTIATAQISTKGIIGSADAFHDKAHVISGANHSGSITAAQGLGKPQALTGAVSATNYVGATASVAPTTGTFAIGDFVITHTGKVYICTTAGTPGTWTQAGGGGLATDTLADAKGDIFAATAADTIARVAVGTNGQAWVADSTATPGVRWDTKRIAALTAATAAISTTETVVVNGTVKANTLAVGDVIKIRASLVGTTGTGTWTPRIRFGPTTLTGTVIGFDVPWLTFTGSRTNMPAFIDGEITVASIGATGTLNYSSWVACRPSTSDLLSSTLVFSNHAAIVVNTTVDNLLELTSITSAAGSSVSFNSATFVKA